MKVKSNFFSHKPASVPSGNLCFYYPSPPVSQLGVTRIAVIVHIELDV